MSGAAGRGSGPAYGPRRAAALLLAVGTLVATLVAGCTPGHLPTAPPTPTASKTPRTTTSSTPAAATTTTSAPPAPVTTQPQGVAIDTNGAVAMAVGPQPGNWDIHSAAAADWQLTLHQVLAQVWPSAFYTSPSGLVSLNSALLNSATELTTSPQVVEYQINPKAVWSDGSPITWADFAYNWKAQSGAARFKDLAGRPFTPLRSEGYDDISSVTGSASSPYTVTVKFASPYADWRSLFAYLMPAHVAEHVGFDAGFTNPVADLVSGGPLMVAEAQDGYSLQLVRNGRYWAAPANLADVTYYFTQGAAEAAASIAGGGADLGAFAATVPTYRQLKGASGVVVTPEASNLYEDLDFNQARGPLAQPVLRQAIMMATDRASMAAQVLGPFGLSATPVEDRLFLPGSPGYAADGSAYDHADPTGASGALAKAGYTMTGGTLHTPAGQAVALTLWVAADDPVADQLAQSVASGCASIGVDVTVSQFGPPSGDVLEDQGTGRLPSGWQMAIELRAVPAYPSYGVSRFVPSSGEDTDGYASPAMLALLALVPATPAAQLAALYGQVDTRAWLDFTDLPLVQLPVLVARQSDVLNVSPGPYVAQLGFNEQDWGIGH